MNTLNESKYINDRETLLNYLEAIFEEADNDQATILNGISEVSKSVGITKISEETKLDRTHLYRAFKEEGNPTLSTFLKILDSLDLSLRVTRK